MRSPLRGYVILAKRWAWLILLGIVICAGAGYMIGKSTKPVYQATAFLVVNLSSTAVPYDVNGSMAIAPTYAQLITSPAVLEPVVANHPGLTEAQLSGMVSVKPQANTQNIELDVQNTNNVLAMQLANEISQSLDAYVNAHLSGGLQIVPADLPTSPVNPKTSITTAIGALIGLALAIALIVLFEWIDDRLDNLDEVKEIIGLDSLAVISKLPRNQRAKHIEDVPALAEGSNMLAANLNAAQAVKPFKLVMVTSALPQEGRSTIAANLAMSLAKAGKNVLLVDADMRRPNLHNLFQLGNLFGLSSALTDTWVDVTADGSENILDGRPTEIQRLRVLTSGVPSANPAELLQSPEARRLFDHFKKTATFDYIIVDTPPLLPVADAQVLASYVQAAVLVVDASRTPRKILARAKQVVSKMRTNTLGVVVNKSLWSEDGKVSDYLKDVWKRQAKITITMSTPPSTPPVEDLVEPAINHDADHDITLEINHDLNHDTNHDEDLASQDTLTLARPQKDSDGNH